MNARLAPVAGSARLAVRSAMILLLLSVTVFQRFGITAGDASVSAALFAAYGFVAMGALTGMLVISKARMAIYVLCSCVAIASAVLNEALASTSSLLLVVVMYFPFVLLLRPKSLSDNDALWAMSRFLDIGLLCAVAGIAQFAAQFVIHADWLFDFTRYIPTPLRATGGFNTVIPVGSIYKSNGFFFREPSGFSYVMALSLMAECVGQKRVYRLVCFGLALLLTYSGTGLLALLIGVLHPFGAKTAVRVAALGALGALAFWLLGDALNLSFTLGRINEFSADHSQSSGYIRYVAPFRLLGELFFSQDWAPWVGHGAGSISRTLRSYQFHDPTWAKLLFEYGALGFVAFLLLFLVTVRRSFVAPQVSGMLFWGWLVMGGHLLSAEQNYLTLALAGLLPAAATFARRSQLAPSAGSLLRLRPEGA